jgi:hypothetical protein
MSHERLSRVERIVLAIGLVFSLAGGIVFLATVAIAVVR